MMTDHIGAEPLDQEIQDFIENAPNEYIEQEVTGDTEYLVDVSILGDEDSILKPHIHNAIPDNWRVAHSLNILLQQVNMIAPRRSIGSDGSIGDKAHEKLGSASDHNAWVRDSRGQPIVTARDLTHDPNGGLDAGFLAEVLRVGRDPRIKYVISNRLIFLSFPDKSSKTPPWTWMRYNGANPHDRHVHISVLPRQQLYDNGNLWRLPNRLRR